MKLFEHGGNVTGFAELLGCSVEEICDLSSNINPYKPTITTDFNTLDLSSYPDYTRLYTALENHFEVANGQLEIFNGGSSAIFSLFKTLSLRECVIYAPAYAEYKRAAQIYGYNLTLINRREELLTPIPDNALIIFVNPSTPDGVFYDLKPMMKHWAAHHATILIDESFLEFTDHPSASKYLATYENLYLLKSLTKFYSCAGVRAGVLISNESNMDRLRSAEPLWKVSQFDQHYLLDALRDKVFVLKTKNKTFQNLQRLQRILEASGLFDQVFPSDANFILAKLATMDAAEFQEKLAPYKIMVRNCANFDFLDERYVRIAVKKKKSLRKLKEALCSLA